MFNFKILPYNLYKLKIWFVIGLLVFSIFFGLIITASYSTQLLYVTKSVNSGLKTNEDNQQILTNSTDVAMNGSFYSGLKANEKNQRISKNKTDVAMNGLNAKHVFREVKDSNVYSFYNVCVEERQPPVFQAGWRSKETQRVVVYRGLSGSHDVTFQRSNISVAGSIETDWNHWELFITNASIPSSHTLLPTTAFFVSETIPDNLYHVWNNVFLPLLSVVRDANRLHPGMHNQILYRNPRSDVNLSDPVCKLCRRSPYDILQDTLHTTKKYFVFYELPTNTCYSSAVFGARYGGGKLRDAVDYVLKELKLSYKRRSKNKRLIIVKRRNRRIRNIRDLLNEAKRVGFRNARVVDLESMTVLEQMKMITDTDILIGVQGAALQWGIFMRNGSTVVEISWPKKYWGSAYSSLRNYGIRFISFETNEVFVNWNEYEKRFRKVNSAERTRMLNRPPRTRFYDNIWKFADINVNVKQFRELLKKLI